jgi:hypothetical protein
MDSKQITRIQVIIAIIALVYFIAPDLMIGHLDDAAVAGIAAIADIILGITKSRISRSSAYEGDIDF